MLHRVEGKTLGRSAAHRSALLRNLSDSLVINGRIETTLVKAKYLKPYIESIITRAKRGSDFNAVKYLKNKLYSDKAVRKLLVEVAPSYINRIGGYVRVIKLPNRKGDRAPMAAIEFILERENPKLKPRNESKSSPARKEEIRS